MYSINCGVHYDPTCSSSAGCESSSGAKCTLYSINGGVHYDPTCLSSDGCERSSGAKSRQICIEGTPATQTGTNEVGYP